MSSRPMATTPFVLARLLREFAMATGMNQSLATVAAVEHLRNSALAPVWDEFLVSNCSGCSHSPESCPFLDPREEDCHRSATPETLRAANMYMVETGRVVNCPVISRISLRPVSNNTGGGEHAEHEHGRAQSNLPSS